MQSKRVDYDNDVTRSMAIVTASTSKQRALSNPVHSGSDSPMGISDIATLDTLPTKALPHPKAKTVSLYRQLIVLLFILAMGFAMGMGFSRTIDQTDNLSLYCSHGACMQVYHLPCSNQLPLSNP